MPDATASAPRIAILGAGMSGLCMGIQLARAGIHSFTIYEKNGNVGGTWRDNTYPGLACDVPSHLYSFSFEPNPDWSHLFSPGWEIQKYLEGCVEKYGLGPHMRLGVEIVTLVWDDATRHWRLRTREGESIEAEVVVTAVGALHRPKLPEIPGLESFAGVAFHSARWEHAHDLTGRKLAVIGSAASAVQIVPTIAAQVAQLTVFQRTPNWLRPRQDFAYPERWKHRFQRFPLLAKLHRGLIYALLESRFPAFLRGGLGNRLERRACFAHLARQVPDPALRAALTPDYAPGCKRILVSDDFYPALLRDNVTLVTDRIARIEPAGVVTADGKLHAVDTIVYATGFHVAEMLAPMTATGRGGRSLEEAWKNGVEAHRTVALAGFPNFFMLLGPNSGLGHNSIIFMVEQQIRYILECLQALIHGRALVIEPKQAASDRYNAKLQRDMRKTIWMSGCRSWYQDDHGKVVALWPHGTLQYWREMRRVDFDEYETAKSR